MASDVNVTVFNRQFAMDSASDEQKASSSHFPVVPVAVSVSLFFVLIALALLLYIIRRRYRYHDYTSVGEGPIKPEILNTLRTKGKPWGLSGSKVSSDDSLAPLSSEDELDASSREPSPTRELAEEEEEEETYPEGHIGRIWFSTSYDFNRESLTIVLHKIKNLPDRSDAIKYCDPGVKISLLPNKQHLAQSRYKRKNKNPVFNEKFEVNLPSYELQNGTLCLKVFDGYRSSQQVLIGHVLYPLKQLDTTMVNELQRDLTIPVEETSSIGQVHVSLSYYPTLHRLTVIILRATNLRKLTYRQTDSFVKVAFSIGNKVMKTKKTVVHTETQSPMYNESFNFTVNEDDLESSTLMISVMHNGGGIVEDKPIGRVLLGGTMYARGRECDHWLDMMNSPRKMVKCWHELQKC